MISTNIKIAWRNLKKHKFLTLINIVGLACGLSFALVIAAYIFQETIFDGQLKNLRNQYILQSDWKSPDMGFPLSTIGALPKALKEEYPDLVRNYYRFDGITCILAHEEQVFNESAALGDSSLLSMYGFPLLYGDASTALKDPFSVVITRDIAIKYFGKTDIIGQQLSIKNFNGESHPFTITAVFNNLPGNSVTNMNESLNNKIFLSSESVRFFGRNIDSWQNPFIAGYVELQPGITPQMLKQPLHDLLKKHADEKIADNLTPILKPLSNYHLEKDNGLIKKMGYTLGVIAGFILLMAVVNFVNISVHASVARLKEIGVRKVMGSSKKQLSIQFLSESVLMVGIAFLIALLCYSLIKPAFSTILGQDLPGISDFPYTVYGSVLLAMLLIGLLAGLYPALRLSALKTMSSIKGKMPPNISNISFLQSLVAFQFIIALGVCISAGIISRQVSLFFGDQLGYDKASLITLPVPRDWSEAGLNRMKTIQRSLKELPPIENVSLSYSVPGGQGLMSNGTLNFAKETGDATQQVAAQYITSDTSFASTYKIPLLAGRFLDEEINPDVAKLVISEKAVQLLGFHHPEEALNKQVYLKPNDFPAIIVGVTDDFYASSMRDPLSAVVWTNIKADNLFRYFSIRLNPGNIAEQLTSIEKEWKKWLPDAPFDYRFMDENIQHLYKTELQLKKASYIATSLSSLIVFLGLVALISLNLQKRKKEMGVRKVLGATVHSIIALFMRDLARTFLIAMLIACPLAYILIDRWLQNYSIQMQLNPLFFGLPALFLALIAAAIISLQTFKTANSNPVDSLRDE